MKRVVTNNGKMEKKKKNNNNIKEIVIWRKLSSKSVKMKENLKN